MGPGPSKQRAGDCKDSEGGGLEDSEGGGLEGLRGRGHYKDSEGGLQGSKPFWSKPLLGHYKGRSRERAGGPKAISKQHQSNRRQNDSYKARMKICSHV